MLSPWWFDLEAKVSFITLGCGCYVQKETGRIASWCSGKRCQHPDFVRSRENFSRIFFTMIGVFFFCLALANYFSSR